ncbi:MAG: hemin uptake protein HemP [Pseudomonadota bacterium]
MQLNNESPANPVTPDAHAASFARPRPATGVQRPAAPETIAADHLFRGRQEVLIAHGDETYRLRLTRNGKLILTK